MSYEMGDIVLWSRNSTPGYYGVITDSELRPSPGASPPWRWFKVKFANPLPIEMLGMEWFRCDHINIVTGFQEISKIHAAMIVSESIKARVR